jgi:DNA-binding CsgD family transcriptional regulator
LFWYNYRGGNHLSAGILVPYPSFLVGFAIAMSLMQHLLQALGRLPTPRRLFHFDEELVQSLQDLAEREQRSEEEVAADLLTIALAQRDAAEVRIQAWRGLSFREQQVVALTCLGYTNRQIAARLRLSPETVKSHIRSSQRKLGVRTKAELRHALADWDFGKWE